MLSHHLKPLRPGLAGSLCMLLALAACTHGDLVGGSGPTDPDASSPESNPKPDPEPDPQTDPSAVVFADDTVLTYELTVAPADWQRLQDNPLAEEYVPATLSFQGQQFGPIGLRYKGNYSLTACFNGNQQICPKVSFKLKLNEYQPELRMLGLKRLNLHSMFNDASMMRDRLAYSLYRDIGVPAPRMAHARVVINGEYLGIYAAIEQVDGRFTRSRYPDGGEGNLYKEVWPIYSNLDPYQAALKTNEDENPRFDKMLRFAADLAAADDQSFESVLSSWVDVDTLMRLLAVDRAIGNWDGPVSSWYCFGECKNHNYYWYEETGRDRMWLIPWDMNDTFKPFLVDQIRSQGLPDWDELEQSCGSVIILGGISAQPPSCDDFIHRLGTVLRPRYVAAGRQLVAGPLSAAAVQAKLVRWSAQLEPLVAADPNGPGIDTWRRERDNLARFADEMRQSFATALDR